MSIYTSRYGTIREKRATARRLHAAWFASSVPRERNTTSQKGSPIHDGRCIRTRRAGAAWSHRPELLPATVRQFVAECWPGMSRGQPVARARRLVLRPSLRVCRASAPGEIGLFALTLTVGTQIVSLVAHLRRVATRRASARQRKVAAASRPPARDPRQASLF